ncbi:hypothetical protein C0Q70_06079 [Pomacea canaliculata]|uniref:Uncharacterized protein n=1 Tax=Pomacea canaliculata TaxID=400727 RepID=A0A2T7PN04_POMCA|nr:hypothetical protein C0Q70_06079 [Pomacea canaliculata]
MAGDLLDVMSLARGFATNAKQIQTDIEKIIEKENSEIQIQDELDVLSPQNPDTGKIIQVQDVAIKTEPQDMVDLSVISESCVRWAEMSQVESEPSDAETISSDSSSDDWDDYESYSSNSDKSSRDMLVTESDEDTNKWLTLESRKARQKTTHKSNKNKRISSHHVDSQSKNFFINSGSSVQHSSTTLDTCIAGPDHYSSDCVPTDDRNFLARRHQHKANAPTRKIVPIQLFPETNQLQKTSKRKDKQSILSFQQQSSLSLNAKYLKDTYSVSNHHAADQTELKQRYTCILSQNKTVPVQFLAEKAPVKKTKEECSLPMLQKPSLSFLVKYLHDTNLRQAHRREATGGQRVTEHYQKDMLAENRSSRDMLTSSESLACSREVLNICRPSVIKSTISVKSEECCWPANTTFNSHLCHKDQVLVSSKMITKCSENETKLPHDIIEEKLHTSNKVRCAVSSGALASQHEFDPQLPSSYEISKAKPQTVTSLVESSTNPLKLIKTESPKLLEQARKRFVPAPFPSLTTEEVHQLFSETNMDMFVKLCTEPSMERAAKLPHAPKEYRKANNLDCTLKKEVLCVRPELCTIIKSNLHQEKLGHLTDRFRHMNETRTIQVKESNSDRTNDVRLHSPVSFSKRWEQFQTPKKMESLCSTPQSTPCHSPLPAEESSFSPLVTGHNLLAYNKGKISDMHNFNTCRDIAVSCTKMLNRMTLSNPSSPRRDCRAVTQLPSNTSTSSGLYFPGSPSSTCSAEGLHAKVSGIDVYEAFTNLKLASIEKKIKKYNEILDTKLSKHKDQTRGKKHGFVQKNLKKYENYMCSDRQGTAQGLITNSAPFSKKSSSKHTLKCAFPSKEFLSCAGIAETGEFSVCKSSSNIKEGKNVLPSIKSEWMSNSSADPSSQIRTLYRGKSISCSSNNSDINDLPKVPLQVPTTNNSPRLFHNMVHISSSPKQSSQSERLLLSETFSISPLSRKRRLDAAESHPYLPAHVLMERGKVSSCKRQRTNRTFTTSTPVKSSPKESGKSFCMDDTLSTIAGDFHVTMTNVHHSDSESSEEDTVILVS